MKKEVLGIKIDDINIEQAVNRVLGFLKQGGKHYIVTPNPEIVMMAQKDEELKKILNNANLSIPDGKGLRIAADIVCYTPGIDLMESLIKSSLDYGFTIGLLGGAKGVAEKGADCLRKKYPEVKIVYAESGPQVDNDGNVIARSVATKQSLLRLPRPFGARNDKEVDLLFVGFGAPKQEKWVAENINKLDVKVMMAVGGSLDYISGQVPRAPKFIRKLGFEWLFRLIIQPRRIKRQLALLKYLWLVLWYKH